ncbi:NADH dehydrogenase [Paracidovorax valerianellae]|uniref:NADH dehydrogenase n=2 Tax=Paracidovorax valerianellae TaxID=187868 RepID=A0A1G6YQG1_9BURK|nr:NAD(P)/FAD-dependent oxidoreductase [Paracidovorax valerianellae]SDD91776.1 NADH dehydrogenase [Paracidovorax valerianellae]
MPLTLAGKAHACSGPLRAGTEIAPVRSQHTLESLSAMSTLYTQSTTETLESTQHPEAVAVAPQPSGSVDPIVVVGGGAAGLELVTRLSRLRKAGHRLAPVVLVDRALGHLWKPRLHEIATAMQGQASAESSFLSHASQHGYRFELGTLESIDAQARRIFLTPLVGSDLSVLLPRRSLAYSSLVLALGSEENDFGTPGAREHCLFLNTPEQALKIRQALLSSAFRVARGVQEGLSIVVIGGGATGVELAAEIQHAIEELRGHEPGVGRAQVRVTVIEAAPRLLNANPPEVSEYAARSLRERGVELLVGERVQQVDALGVQLASGRYVEAELRIWTAGIRGPRVLDGMQDLPVSRSGRVRVNDWLRCEDVPGLYALGDCAEWTDPESGKPAPYTAQVASAQARYLAKAMAAQAAGRAIPAFQFASAGAIVSLGDRGAAGNLTTRFGRRSRDQFIQGLSAQWLYAVLYRRHELAIHGWRRAAARWLVDRLERSYQPTIKLH